MMLGRIALFFLVGVLGVLTLQFFTWANDFFFHYQNPAGFFVIPNFSDEILGLTISLVFWGAVLYGIFGKMVDHVLFGLIFIFALWNYFSTENVTPDMYIGLAGAAFAGTILGYAFKVLRLRYWRPAGRL